MKQQIHLIISGRVQGVFFRASSKRVADALEITGWVRNLPGGQVELLAQGQEQQLNQLIDWCRQGPANATVDEVSINWQQRGDNYSAFEIR